MSSLTAPQRGTKDSQNLAMQTASGEELARYEEGWRRGKPVEDPAKLKRWGFITAKPSEFLVSVKDGRIDLRRSGQGMRVWKWPWQAVAIIPTTLQQLDFVADQITRERVGVQVTGIAVYRIAHPEIAYRMLNFTYGERASEKLAQTMREMFIGAARRLIANLTLDQCLMQRKEALATFLMQEIAPVVAGNGRSEDTTEQGWGVIIDTIEIQDVKILSDSVFRHLQAPYRAEIAMRAELADLERGQKVAETRSMTERQTAEAVIQTQRETRMLKAKAEADAAERESAEQLRAEQAKSRVAVDDMERRDTLAKKKILMEEGIALRQAESKAALDSKNLQHRLESELQQYKLQERQAESKAAMEAKNLQHRLESELQQLKLQEQKRVAAAQTELSTLATEVELAEQSHRAELRKLELDSARKQMAQQISLSLQQQKSNFEQENRRREAETKRIEAETEAAQQRALADIEQVLNHSRALRELITQGLPHIASAFKQSFGTINYTQLSGGEDGGPLNVVGQAIGQVLSVAKTFGLDPARLSQPPPPQQPPRNDEDKPEPRR